MNEITQAINERRRIAFKYHDKRRLVEPQCYGVGTKGNELLRGHQLSGGSQAEPLFEVTKMTDLVVLDEHFTKPGPNYKRNDSAMRVIFAQL
jgi:predicted DNA-binding transcriptional regulator YafY